MKRRIRRNTNQRYSFDELSKESKQAAIAGWRYDTAQHGLQIIRVSKEISDSTIAEILSESGKDFQSNGEFWPEE